MRALYNYNHSIGDTRFYARCVAVFWLALFLLFLSLSVLAQSEPNQNTKYQALPNSVTLSLADNNIFYFELEKDEIATFRASQHNADVVYVFSRYEQQTVALIKSSDITDSSYLSDIASVSFDECKRCIVEIFPSSSIDRQGNSLLQTAIFQPDPNTADMHRSLSLGSVNMYQASHNNDIADDRYSAAVTHYNEAVKSAKLVGDIELVSYGLYVSSLASHYQHKFTRQKEILTQILDRYDLSPEMAIRAQIDLAELYFEDLVSLDEAQALLNRAKELSATLSQSQLYAKVLQSQAMLNESTDDLEKANTLWERALAVQYENSDIRRVVKNLVNLGWTEYNHGQHTKAINYYNRALSYLPQNQPTQEKTNIDIKLAKAYRALGDFDRANQFIDSALMHNQNYPNAYVHGWAFQEKARILMVSGQPVYAIPYLKKAMHAYRLINAHSEMVDIHYFLGDVFISLEQFSEAQQHVEYVLENDKRGNSYRDIASGFHKLAQIEWSYGAYESAIANQKQAIDFIEGISDKTLKPFIYGQAAAMLAETGFLPEARQFYDQALLALSGNSFDYRKIKIQYDYAFGLTQSGNHKLAAELIKEVPQQAVEHARQIQRPDLKRRYVATLQEIVELYTFLHASDKDALSALLLSEELRATSLVLSQRSKKSQPINQLFATKRETLFSELLSTADELNTNHIEKKANAHARIQALTDQLYILESQYFYDNEQDYTVQNMTFETSALEKLREQLAPDEVILYVDTGELNSSIWFISNANIKQHSFQSDSAINEVAKVTFQRVVEQHSDVNSDLSTLSEMIFASSNFSFDGVKHIKVVTDGALSLIPFSLLTYPQMNGWDFTVSYSASLRTMNLNSVEIGLHATALAIGNPKMVNTQDELPYSQLEIDALRSLPTTELILLTRENASKTGFQQSLDKEFDLIHIATHGIANTQQHAVSGLVFSNSIEDQNFLIATEIASLNLNSKLVVLSGCETTLGELIPGEGLMGLSRAFFEAGVTTVIGSLWKVQDSATAALFTQFYKHLLEDNLSPAESLTLAKHYVRNYRRANGVRPWQHPFYWSGFVMYDSKSDSYG